MTEQDSTPPKVFISYSWSTAEHQEWVLALAKRLTGDGIDVILDKWELREGQDKYAFMERMVTDKQVSKVLAICDRVYAEKAEARKGGVGTESQIISKEVYDKVDQNKFIAIVREYDDDGDPYVPPFFSSRIYIDMSTEERELENYDQLLRAIFNKPLHVKPSLGKPPAHLFEQGAVPSKTIYKVAVVKRAILDDKTTVHGLIGDYLESYLAAIEDFRINGDVEGNYDEHVMSNLEKFLPYRDEFIDMIKFVTLYREDEKTYQLFVEFFQKLLRYLHPPSNVHHYQDWSFDNYRFILFELFLYQLSVLIKAQRFEMANLFLSHLYFDAYEAKSGGPAIAAYGIFDQYPQTIDRLRKNRLRLRNYYVSAEVLKNRAYHADLNFEILVQTDFVLFLRTALNPSTEYHDYWNARTAGYAEGYRVFEIFARATSRDFFNRIKILLNVANKQDLDDKYKAAVENRRITRSEHMGHVHTSTLINLEQLDTR